MSTQLSGGYLADYPQDVYPGGGKNSGDDGHDNKEDISAKVPWKGAMEPKGNREKTVGEDFLENGRQLRAMWRRESEKNGMLILRNPS